MGGGVCAPRRQYIVMGGMFSRDKGRYRQDNINRQLRVEDVFQLVGIQQAAEVMRFCIQVSKRVLWSLRIDLLRKATD